MAKLIIYRGDTLDREMDLGERNARIGRGDQNDIVLPDPAKSVSRFHAELRFEQGRFSIVDLNSQNGTWVAGRRVQQAALEPGVPVVLGTYRLVLKKEEPPPSPVTSSSDATMVGGAAVAEPASAATMIMPGVTAAAPPLVAKTPAAPPRPVPPPAPLKVEPRPEPKSEPAPAPTVEPPPAPKADPPTPAPKPEPPPVKVEPPKPAPRPEPPKPAPKPEPPKAPPPPPAAAAKPVAPPKPAGKGMSKGLLFGGFAVLALAVMGAAVFLTPLKSRLASLTGGGSADSSAVAIPAGASPAGDPAKPPEGQPSTAGSPSATETPAVAAPLAPKPAATAARPAKGTRDTGATAAPRDRTAAGAARRPAAPPEAKPKPINLAQTLEDARSAMIKGDYLAAVAGFEAILKVDPKYANAADLLGVARGGAKNASQLAVDGGNKAEMSGDYANATKQYERAAQLDPDSTSAPDAMRRLKARMQSEGEDVFKRARQYDALGRATDAIAMYEKVLLLLPPDHANAKTAKERLAALKGGL